MKTTVIQKFDSIYSHYLCWFRERATADAAPLEKEDFPRFQSFHEDVFETDRILLNRMYYILPLSPTHSLSGKLEVFSFSELNLMEVVGGEIADVRPVEYRIELK